MRVDFGGWLFAAVMFVAVMGIFLSKSLFRFAGSGLRLAGVLGFDVGFQAVEVRGPEGAVLLDPGIDRAQRLRIELVDAVTSFAMLANQMCAAQQAEMF